MEPRRYSSLALPLKRGVIEICETVDRETAVGPNQYRHGRLAGWRILGERLTAEERTRMSNQVCVEWPLTEYPPLFTHRPHAELANETIEPALFIRF